MKKLLLALFLLVALPVFHVKPALATVAVNSARDSYTGNAVTTSFTYTFRILDQTHIAVYVAGVLQTLSTHYSVTSVGSTSGSIVFVTAPANAAAVLFVRNVPLNQLSTYIPNEAFPSTRVERDYDKVWMALQMHAEALSRTLRLPVTSAGSVGSLTPGASTVIGWNSTGTGFQNYDLTAGAIPAGSAYQPLRVPAAGGAAAFGALDISQAAAITGVLPFVNGGLGVAGSTLTASRCLQVNAGGTAVETAAAACGSGGGGSSLWNAVGDPDGNQALTMAARTSAWTWNATTGSGVNLLTLTDTASNTGTGFVMSLATAASSAAKPLRVTAGGTANGVQMTTTGGLEIIGTGTIKANRTPCTGVQYLLFDGTCGAASSQWTTSGANIHYPTGNVGINNVTPAEKLDIVGNLKIASGVYKVGAASGQTVVVSPIASPACETLYVNSMTFTGGILTSFTTATSGACPDGGEGE